MDSQEYSKRSALLEKVYGFESQDLKLEQNLKIVRTLIHSDDLDLQEIAILRLGCRACDLSSFDEIYNIFKSSLIRNNPDEDLVFSASVRALICLSVNRKNKEWLKSSFFHFFDEMNDCDRRHVLKDAINDLN